MRAHVSGIDVIRDAAGRFRVPEDNVRIPSGVSCVMSSRYLERAEGTSRILDVHLQLLVEDPTVDQRAASRSLLAVMGATPDGPPTLDTVMVALCHDPASPSSMWPR